MILIQCESNINNPIINLKDVRCFYKSETESIPPNYQIPNITFCFKNKDYVWNYDNPSSRDVSFEKLIEKYCEICI